MCAGPRGGGGFGGPFGGSTPFGSSAAGPLFVPKKGGETPFPPSAGSRTSYKRVGSEAVATRKLPFEAGVERVPAQNERVVAKSVAELNNGDVGGRPPPLSAVRGP